MTIVLAGIIFVAARAFGQKIFYAPQFLSSTTRDVASSGASTFSDYFTRYKSIANHLDDVNIREWVVEIDYFRGSTSRNVKILLYRVTYLFRTDLLLVRRTMTRVSVLERQRRKPT
jgi:hypothetical protein